MKLFLIHLFIFSHVLVFGQDSIGQAGIFKVRLFVDKALTNSYMVSSTGQPMNGYSSFRFNMNQQDSIKMLIQKTVRNQLFKNSEFIYDLKTDGTKRSTLETGTFAGGFPKMTKKRAIFAYEEDLYVKVKIKVQGYNGPKFGVAGVQYSNIHPSVKFKLKAFDSSKKKVYSRKIRLWDFDKINSVQITNQFSTITQTNALNSEQIYQMIRHTIRVFNEEEEKRR